MKKEVWDSMLDADLNNRYWSHLSRKYYQRDRRLKIFLAVMSSGTVAGWGLWTSYPSIWKILSAISALTAIALPILDWPKTIEGMANLKQKWCQIKYDYEMIWLEMKGDFDNLKVCQEFKKTKEKEAAASQNDTNLPHDEKLILRCRDEVLKSRGLI